MDAPWSAIKNKQGVLYQLVLTAILKTFESTNRHTPQFGL